MSKINRALCKACRRDKTIYEYFSQLSRKWKKGQNPYVSVPNPDVEQRNKRMIRVRINDWWGDPNRYYDMYDESQNRRIDQ